MITTLDLRGRRLTRAELLALVPRALTDVAAASGIAEQLIADVRDHGERALLDQAERLDGVRPARARVAASQLTEALAGLDPDVRSALETAIDRVRSASSAQLREPVTTVLGPGAEVVQRWVPVTRVGLYVPGG